MAESVEGIARQITEAGKTLREAREAAGLTQEDLAKVTGLTAAQISEFETGRLLNPTPGALKRLAEALGLPSDTFAQLLSADKETKP